MTPFVIGIAGGTGSGKTTLTRNIVEALRRTKVSVLRGDWYYRDQSDIPPEDRPKVNYDHPDAVETELLIKHVKALKKGRRAPTPRYDFVVHNRTRSCELVRPTPVVIVEGILIFVEEKLREIFDLMIFVETAADLRLIRRLTRDLAERGRSFESSIHQYLRTVRPMHETFVEPSKKFADIIVPAGAPNEKAISVIVDMIQRRSDRQRNSNSNSKKKKR